MKFPNFSVVISPQRPPTFDKFFLKPYFEGISQHIS